MFIHTVCSCDTWKSAGSMRLQFVTASKKKLLDWVLKEIEEGNIEGRPDKIKEIAQKNDGFDLINEFNSYLQYAYFEGWED